MCPARFLLYAPNHSIKAMGTFAPWLLYSVGLRFIGFVICIACINLIVFVKLSTLPYTNSHIVSSCNWSAVSLFFKYRPSGLRNNLIFSLEFSKQAAITRQTVVIFSTMYFRSTAITSAPVSFIFLDNASGTSTSGDGGSSVRYSSVPSRNLRTTICIFFLPKIRYKKGAGI